MTLEVRSGPLVFKALAALKGVQCAKWHARISGTAVREGAFPALCSCRRLLSAVFIQGSLLCSVHGNTSCLLVVFQAGDVSKRKGPLCQKSKSAERGPLGLPLVSEYAEDSSDEEVRLHTPHFPLLSGQCVDNQTWWEGEIRFCFSPEGRTS